MEYFGNLSHIIDKYIDISKLINGIRDELILDESKRIIGDEQSDMLFEAGYVGFKWIGINYFPNVHFSKELIYELDNVFKTKVIAAWINEIPVGKVFPPHRDHDPRFVKIKKLGKLVTYNIHIGDPSFGHVFFIDNKVNYMQNHGDCYKWTPNQLHSAGNVGFKPKFNLIYNGVELFEPIDINYRWDFIDETLGDCKEYCINWDYEL